MHLLQLNYYNFLNGNCKQSSITRNAVTNSTKVVLDSFGVSYLIVNYNKLHTIRQTLLLPADMKRCEIMQGEKYDKALKTVFLSLSEDIIEQLLTSIKCSPKFALQINESSMLQD